MGGLRDGHSLKWRGNSGMEPKSTWVGTVLGWSPTMAFLVGVPRQSLSPCWTNTWAMWRHLLEKREDSNCSPWMLNLIRWHGEQETAASSANPAFERHDSRWPHWRESPLWQSQGNSGTPMTLRSHTHRILSGMAGNMSKPCTVSKRCRETEVTWARMNGERPWW